MFRHPATLLALLAAAPAIGGDAPRAVMRWTGMMIHERIVIRIPRFRDTPARAALPDTRILRWKEKGGPHCIGTADITGAAIGASDAVDLLMADGKRMRARLGRDCPSIDFYDGFYLRPDPDGKVCGTRDTIRSRSGAACPIRDFRRLVATAWR